jgi:hypothetical protein
MIILSFNPRGVGGTRKKLSLKRLLLILNPNVVLIQGTLAQKLVV